MAEIIHFESIVEAAQESLPEQVSGITSPLRNLAITLIVGEILLLLAGLYFVISTTGLLPSLHNSALPLGISCIVCGSMITPLIAPLMKKGTEQYHQRLHELLVKNREVALTHVHAPEMTYPYKGETFRLIGEKRARTLVPNHKSF